MRQLALAVMMYTRDYEDTLPRGYLALPGGGVFPWPLAVAPYAKNTAIFRCPSDRNPMPVKAWLPSRDQKTFVDFSLSIIGNYNVMPPEDLDSVRLTEIESPSRLINMVDMRDLRACPGWDGQWGVLPFHQTIRGALYGRQLLTGDQVRSALDQCENGKTPTGEGAKFGPRVATRRHSGGENYIFADGHVRWMHFQQTLYAEGGTEGSMWAQHLMRYVP